MNYLRYSYTFRGEKYSWESQDYHSAIDVEALDTPLPSIARNEEKMFFFTRWTQAEVICKLLNIPILLFFKAYGLDSNQDIAKQNDISFISGFHEVYHLVYTCGVRKNIGLTVSTNELKIRKILK